MSLRFNVVLGSKFQDEHGGNSFFRTQHNQLLICDLFKLFGVTIKKSFIRKYIIIKLNVWINKLAC